MSKVVRINATLDPSLLDRVDAYAARMMEDRSTAIRQLLDRGLRALAEDEAIVAFRAGRITLREFARLLGFDVLRAQDLLQDRGVAVARGPRSETAEALAEALETHE